MRRFLVLIGPLLACLALAAPAGAIVAGKGANLADYPFFAVVGSGCGGALIAPDRVLTAAHCTEALDETAAVRVGPKEVRRRVVLRAINPLHVREQAKQEREFPPPAGDLMLLRLNKPVRGVEPVPIATATEGLTAAGTAVITIGRGATGTDEAGLGTFREGTVQIQPPSACPEQLGTKLLRRWSLCTRDPRMADPRSGPPFVSACFGDSGGPLLAGRYGAFHLVGVDSWGPSCGEKRDPELYANAVRGRGFVLAKHPVWAPAARGRAAIVGEPRVGATVTCRVEWIVRPTRELAYLFTLDRFQVQEGKRPTYTIRPADRGREISCSAWGATAGGRGGPPGLAPDRLIR